MCYWFQTIPAVSWYRGLPEPTGVTLSYLEMMAVMRENANENLKLCPLACSLDKKKNQPQ